MLVKRAATRLLTPLAKSQMDPPGRAGTILLFQSALRFIVQCSNNNAARALNMLPSDSGRQNKDGSMRKISDTIARLAAMRGPQSTHIANIGSGRLSALGDF